MVVQEVEAFQNTVWAILGTVILAAVVLSVHGCLIAARLRKKQKAEGWSTESSGGGEEFGLTYAEGGNFLRLYGDHKAWIIPDHGPERWDAEMPEFARGRRDEIQARIRSANPRITFVRYDLKS